MKKALQEAQEAFEENEVPVGAVVVLNGLIIGRGHNLTETLHDVTAHAEMQAITAASNFLGAKYLKECTLYVTLEPCLMCAGALSWSQLSRVVYAASDLKKGYHLFSDHIFPKTIVIEQGLLENASVALLKQFFQDRRNMK